MNYLFKTNTVTGETATKKGYWIDNDCIEDKLIIADDIKSALAEYKKFVKDKHDIDISANAIKTRTPMYIDLKTGGSKQIGYVLKAKAEFEHCKDGYIKWIPEYIELWIEIITIVDTIFPENS